MITRPGKTVVWGEYAVLAGAPAGVMAVDALARINWQPANAVSFFARGLNCSGMHLGDKSFSGHPAATLLEAALTHFGYTTYPDGLILEMDTRPFYHGTAKTGLGSSAALCVALTDLIHQWLHQAVTLQDALDIHHAWQGKSGSGLDIACSWHGGMIRFEHGVASHIAWPDDIDYRLVWTGTSASTPAHLASFDTWRRDNDTTPLSLLVTASQELDTGISLQKLAHYTATLQAFDQASRLNIFTPTHAALVQAAEKRGLVYKPCGAGGGDIGMVFARRGDPALVAFMEDATGRGCVTLPYRLYAPDQR